MLCTENDSAEEAFSGLLPGVVPEHTELAGDVGSRDRCEASLQQNTQAAAELAKAKAADTTERAALLQNIRELKAQLVKAEQEAASQGLDLDFELADDALRAPISPGSVCSGFVQIAEEKFMHLCASIRSKSLSGDEAASALEKAADLRRCMPLSQGNATRPPGLTPPRDVTEAMKQRQWRSPENWSMTIRQWSTIIACLKQQPQYVQAKRQGKPYSMYSANADFVKPWSAGTGCGLSILMNPDRAQSAQLMISHAWGEDIAECEEAVLAYKAQHRIGDGATLWFCVFANYQPEDGCGPTVQQQVAMDPFAAVIQSPAIKADAQGFGMLAVHTSQEDLYARLWCVHEVQAALDAGATTKACGSKQWEQGVHRRVEISFKSGMHDRQCLEAAGVQTNCRRAKCGQPADEAMLFERIQQAGGFDRLDDVIQQFRVTVLPDSVQKILVRASIHRGEFDKVVKKMPGDEEAIAVIVESLLKKTDNGSPAVRSLQNACQTDEGRAAIKAALESVQGLDILFCKAVLDGGIRNSAWNHEWQTVKGVFLRDHRFYEGCVSATWESRDEGPDTRQLVNEKDKTKIVSLKQLLTAMLEGEQWALSGVNNG